MSRIRLNIKKIFFLVAVLLLVTGGAAIFWILKGPQVLPEARKALESCDDVIAEERDRWWEFASRQQQSDTALILYPGARINPQSYAPLAEDLAREGIKVYLVSMPLNLAILDYSRAGEITEVETGVERWYLAGHSMGGAMAGRYLNRSDVAAEDFEGLILLASYVDGSDDLSDTDLRALSLYASRDGYISSEDIAASRALLPDHTEWVEIEGGNHSQYGFYEQQSRDLDPQISREKQQRVIVETLLEFISP